MTTVIWFHKKERQSSRADVRNCGEAPLKGRSELSTFKSLGKRKEKGGGSSDDYDHLEDWGKNVMEDFTHLLTSFPWATEKKKKEERRPARELENWDSIAECVISLKKKKGKSAIASIIGPPAKKEEETPSLSLIKKGKKRTADIVPAQPSGHGPFIVSSAWDPSSSHGRGGKGGKEGDS